jgi:hypothetical protein
MGGKKGKKRKRVVLDVSEKVKLIHALENGAKPGDVAQRTGVPQSTLSGILANKEKYLAAWRSGMSKVKAVKVAKYEQVDSALFELLKIMRAENMGIEKEFLNHHFHIVQQKPIEDYFATQAVIASSSKRTELVDVTSSGKKPESSTPAVTADLIMETDATLCCVCGGECGVAHVCQKCLRSVHPFCSTPIEEEGHGKPVICFLCKA